MTQPIYLRVLTSGELSIAVAPDLGGRIIESTDLSNGRQWLWRNHRVPFGPVASGSAYDDAWQGGFEELFPSDAPAVIRETSYPDHGELWSAPWQVVRSDDHTIELAVVGPATGVRIGKRLSIEGARLTIRYSLENPGRAALPHLFKLPPAIDVNEHCRIDLPGGVMEKVDPSSGICWKPSTSKPGRPASICRDVATKGRGPTSSFMCQTFPKGGAESQIPNPDRDSGLTTPGMCSHIVGSS